MPWLNELADGYPVVLAGDLNCLPNYGAAHTALVLPFVADSLVSVALTAVFLIETYHSTHIACTICKHARTITLVGSNSCCHGAWRDNWSYVGDGMGLTFCPG